MIDTDTGKIKRYWGAYGNKPDDTQPRPLQPRRAARAAVPQPGALRRAVQRRPRLRLRPRERPHPGVHEGRQVREGERHQAEDARRRLGVGHRVLEGPAAEVHLPRRRQEREGLRASIASRCEILTSFGDGGRQPGSSTPCTASPPTRRATSTRPKPTRASGFRSSCTRGWRRSPRRIRASFGRRKTQSGGAIIGATGEKKCREQCCAPRWRSSRLAAAAGYFTARTSGQGTGMPSTKNGDWPHYTADLQGTRYSPLDQINATNFSKLEVAWRFKTDNLGTAARVQARRHAARDQRHALRDRRHAALGRRARRQDRRAAVGAQRCAKASAPPSRRASCRAAASPTGPTAAATTASSTSRPAIAWSRSTRKTGAPIPASARTASST